MAKARLGFDIGNSSMKIAVPRGEGLTLHEVRLPENMMERGRVAMPHAFSSFLKTTMKELGIPRGPAGLALPAGQAICRPVTMPRMSERQLLMNLPYEFNDFIGEEPDRYFCDYALCTQPETPEGTEPEELVMMAAAVSKRLVQDYVKMFAEAGVKLTLLLPQEMALLELLGDFRRRTGDRETEYCFVDLGHTGTRIILVGDDKIQATRQINIGGQDADRALADQLGIDVFLADSYKRSNYKDVLDSPACREVCAQVAVELLKVINFYRFTFRDRELRGVYLIGGGAHVPGMREAIGRALELPLWSAADLLPPGADESALSGILAAGMVLAEEG
jgi:type IV pilus assembly protein PilM